MDFMEDFLSESPPVKSPAAIKFKPKAKPRPKKGPPAKPVKEKAATEAPSATLVSDNKAEKESPVAPDVSLGARISFCLDNVEMPSFDSNISGNSAATLKPNVKGQGGALDLVEDITDLSNDPLLSFELVNVTETVPELAEEIDHVSDPSPEKPSGLFSVNENVTEDVPYHAEELDRVSDSSPEKPSGLFSEKENLTKDVPNHTELLDCVSDPSPGRPDGAFSENQNVTKDVPKHAEELECVSDPSPQRPGGPISVDAATDQSEQGFSRKMDLCAVSNILDERGEQETRKTFDSSHSSDNEADEEPVLTDIEANIRGSGFSDGLSEPHENSKSPTKARNDSVEEVKIKKKRGHRAKQVASDSDKLARKRKKALNETNQSNNKPLKKFPRATTRKRRCVYKSLLEAPEDSLDLQKLPIRDLILFSEHKERAAKKQVPSVQPTCSNERVDHLQPEDYPYDDAEPFGFDQDGDSVDEPSISGIQTDTGYFNYHTHMQKKSRVKWSKKDTELFYQGIRQFGSDLSMIEQLFPGRTRGQMKLKLKKEERENPMMIQDAMANKAKDFSHFHLVIERLQEAAAERQQDYSDDDDEASHLMADDGKLGGNLEAGTTTQEAAKTEQNVQRATTHEEVPEAKDESPQSFYDEEEDLEYEGLL